MRGATSRGGEKLVVSGSRASQSSRMFAVTSRVFGAPGAAAMSKQTRSKSLRDPKHGRGAVGKWFLHAPVVSLTTHGGHLLKLGRCRPISSRLPLPSSSASLPACKLRKRTRGNGAQSGSAKSSAERCRSSSRSTTRCPLGKMAFPARPA